jgi:predicted nucleic acid-binding Zn ribbon protein
MTAMPIYVYEVVNDDNQPGERFEIFQKMTDSPLTQHPETGVPVRRVITAPSINIPGRKTAAMAKENVADDSRLEKLGFTKYVKTGKGTYEKRAGQGPDTISPDRPVSPSELPFD